MGRKEASSQPFNWTSFFTALTSFGLVVLVLGAGVGVVLGMRPLERRAAQLPGTRATLIDIRWPTVQTSTGERVTWVPKAERDALGEMAQSALAGDDERFTGESLERVGKAMASSGWFTHTPKIRRVVGGKIEIDGNWRAPAAVVRRDGVDQLISWDGFPMPVTANVGATQFPVIDSPALPAPKLAGGAVVDFNTAWQGEDIAASLELLAVLLRQPWGSQIGGVDAKEFSSTRAMVVTTTFGTRVYWGGRYTKPALGEVSSEQKLAHLSELYSKHNRIDAGYPMIYVNNTKLQFNISATAEALAARIEAMRAQPEGE
ncbi:MAG TPA: hypothetical protein VK157_17115 [Phycisphaerales bacterium]|nr:hypothetical protein [Phycisphaerales bacterium]